MKMMIIFHSSVNVYQRVPLTFPSFQWRQDVFEPSHRMFSWFISAPKRNSSRRCSWLKCPWNWLGCSVNFPFTPIRTVDLGLYYSFGYIPPFAESSTVISCPEIWMSAWLVISRLPFQDISTSHEYTQMYQQTCSWRLDGLCINTQGIKPWILFFFVR